MITTNIPLSQLEPNRGQVEGLPKNPRILRDERFKALKKSIEDDPEMLELRELLVYPIAGGKYVVIGGNMRLRVLQDLKAETAPCKVIPAETPVEKLKAYATKDNVGFGEWDWEQLANEWNGEQLVDWGLDIPTAQDFSGANKEIDIDGMDDEMVIKLKYTEGEYHRVREALSRVAATPEQAVFKLLDL